MHELALCQQLCKQLEQQAQTLHLQEISKVHLTLGTLSCIEPEAMQFCFQALTRIPAASPLLSHCQLIIEPSPADAYCLHCHQHYALTKCLQVCPHCGSLKRDIQGGDAMLITDLEVNNV